MDTPSVGRNILIRLRGRPLAGYADNQISSKAGFCFGGVAVKHKLVALPRRPRRYALRRFAQFKIDLLEGVASEQRLADGNAHGFADGNLQWLPTDGDIRGTERSPPVVTLKSRAGTRCR